MKKERGAKLRLEELGLIEKIAEAVKNGNYTETVCKSYGITNVTYYRWINEGEKALKYNKKDRKSRLYIKFITAIRQAEAECETDAVKILRTALPQNPRLVIEFLERRFPKRWGKQVSINMIRDEAKKLAEELGLPDDDLAVEQILEEAKTLLGVKE